MTLEELEQALNAKFNNDWDAWRTAVNRWLVRGKLNGQHFDAVSDSLTEAMRKVLEWVPLPEIPRRPVLLSLHLFEPYKSGSDWSLKYDGRPYYGICCNTKKKALEFAERTVNRHQQALEKWDSEFHWSLSKTEGLDFVYKD